MSHVLIIDDEESICWGLARLAKKLGHTADVAASAEEGLDAAERHPPDAIFLDVRLPGQDGLTAMPRLRDSAGGVPVVIMTAYGDLDTAVKAVRGGAFEYLVKPFELDVATRTLQRTLESRPVVADPKPKPQDDGDTRIVGNSPAMQEVFKQIALVAQSEACVHVRGESGVGKELVARAIHRHSPRGEGPFVPVHVASLNPSLAESELFGHVRGAFTGADQPRQGLLQQASGGTVFLDEVADIPLSIQVKLLRALELGEVYPVGSPTPVKTDFRLISATNADLRASVAAGDFRNDLYYRLVTLEIRLPPLRERPEDIAALTHHFLRLLAAKNRRDVPQVSDRFWQELRQRPWNGNARELRNALEHALVVARNGPLEAEHLPAAAPAALAEGSATSAAVLSSDGVAEEIQRLIARWAADQLAGGTADALYEQLLRLIEPPLFQAALAEHHNQCAAAARRLGLHRTTLRKKLDDLEIDTL